MKKAGIRGRNVINSGLNNRSRTLQLLFSHKVMSRTAIAAHLDITAAAVTSIVNDFLDAGLLVLQEVLPESQNKVGRRRQPIGINYDWKYILAIDIHSYYIDIAITNMKGDALAERALTPVGQTPREFCSNIAKECIKMLWEQSIPTEKILGAGITLIGPVNQEEGIALHLFRLFDEPVPIRAYFEEDFPFPVAVENNVCAVLLSELLYTDIERDSHNILMLKWGPGVGSALAIHGLIYKGYNYQSPEIGHNLITEDNGLRCNCGLIGCLEPTISADAIVAYIQREIAENPSGRLASAAASLGAPSRENLPRYLDSNCGRLWDFMKSCAHALASVTNNAVHILAPDKLIFMGDLFALDSVVQLFEEQLYSINPNLPPNLCAKIHASSGRKYLGAAAIAMEQFLLLR